MTHSQLIKIIRENHKKDPKPATTGIDDLDDIQLTHMIFKNFRDNNGNPLGLQLSQGGFAIMSSYFKYYELEFPNRINGKHIIFLDNESTMPWHIIGPEPALICFFDAHFAMKAKLLGDLDLLMEIFSKK